MIIYVQSHFIITVLQVQAMIYIIVFIVFNFFVSMAEIQRLRLSHLLIKPGISRWLYIVPTEHRRKFVQHGIGQLTKPGFICAKFLSHFGQDIDTPILFP